MASSEQPRDAHAEEAPPDDDEAPRRRRADADDARRRRRRRPMRASRATTSRATAARAARGFIPDIVRRTFYAGLGAVFTTEEGIRKIASDLKLPKDVANYLIQQAASSKDELFRVVGKELRGFLETVNISGELQKLLTSLSFEIKTEIRFIPNDEAVGGVKPDVKVGRMSFRRNATKTRARDRTSKPAGDKDEG